MLAIENYVLIYRTAILTQNDFYNYCLFALYHSASQCARLQILELDHMGEVTEHIAQAMCKAGLRGLEVLDFTFTRVTPEALTQFNSK